MQTPNYYKELYSILVDKKNNPSVTWQDVQDVKTKYGVNESKDIIRQGARELYNFLDGGWTLVPPDKETVLPTKESLTINADNSQISEKSLSIDDESKLRDYDYLLRLHNYDPDLFEITQAKNSKWHSGNNVLYSSRITVKPKVVEETLTADKINEMLANIKPREAKQYREPNRSSRQCLLISISDLHLNLYASEMLTNNKYDCETAVYRFYEVLDDIVASVRGQNFEEIIFTIGGDMLNADNQVGTTTKGTPQDNEVHLFEAFELALRIITNAIEILADIAPVRVMYVVGNHDETVGWQFAKVVEAYFRNEKRITVDTSPRMRKYYKYGNTMFVFAHDADVKKLPIIVADEAREWWSDIKFTDVFLQHLHSEQILLEDHNMRIQRLPTISGLSKWSYENGFSSQRQNKAFIYDKVTGLRTVIYTNLE
jgi:hypothetical protein